MWSSLAGLLRYRGLITALVGRELKARYRGSVLGFFWSFINPLLLLSIYTFVFTTIMQNATPETQPYAVFFFSGLLPWTWFTTSLMESSGSLIVGGNLIKKVLFPAEILPIVSVLSSMVHFSMGLIILLGFMIYNHHYPDPDGLIWFPVALAVQLVFTLGMALVLSSLTVHFRDVRDLISNLITFWFFATPIIYPHTLPSVQAFKWLFRLNPFYHLAVSYQEILFFHGPVGHARSLLMLGAASVLFFLAAYWLFDRLRDSFAESV
jgi:homopolymeric O-antigen transport system permease protein